MNIALPSNIEEAAFLAWVQTRERQRYELVDGAVVETGCNTRAHAIVVGKRADRSRQTLRTHSRGFHQNLRLEPRPSHYSRAGHLGRSQRSRRRLTATDP